MYDVFAPEVLISRRFRARHPESPMVSLDRAIVVVDKKRASELSLKPGASRDQRTCHSAGGARRCSRCGSAQKIRTFDHDQCGGNSFRDHDHAKGVERGAQREFNRH
jgi:hypothetical protein